MKIAGKKISETLGKYLKQEVRKLKKGKRTLKLVTFLIGESSEQLSFVKIKALLAKKLGIEFELVHMKEVPSFQNFMQTIKIKSIDPKTTGIVIQQPLPAQLSTDSIYEYISDYKEIEGHKHKPFFCPPLGLATLTVLKYIFGKQKIDKDLFINPIKDKHMFKKVFRNKKVVLVGRGITGGQPIGRVLSEFRINYISINSKTVEPQTYLKEADVIITAVGKKVITPDNIKPGAILINAGLRREDGKLQGDYDEEEIGKIANYYTPTPGGLGPIDVIYLYKNLLDAAKMQKERK